MLINLISHKPNIDNNYLYAKEWIIDLFVIKKRESVGLNDSNDSKAFVEY